MLSHPNLATYTKQWKAEMSPPSLPPPSFVSPAVLIALRRNCCFKFSSLNKVC